MKNKAKEKVLTAFGKSYQGRCTICRKYGHKLIYPKCPQRKEKGEKEKKIEYKKKFLDKNSLTAEEKDREIMNVKQKKETEKAGKAVDEMVDLVLCTIIDNDKKQVQHEKKVSFVNGVKFKIKCRPTSIHSGGGYNVNY